MPERRDQRPGEPAGPGRPGRPLLRRVGASRYLLERWGIERAPATLAKLAVVGAGPPYHRAGRWPLYDPDDLDDWAHGLIGEALASTAEHTAACTAPLIEPSRGAGAGKLQCPRRQEAAPQGQGAASPVAAVRLPGAS